MKKVLLTTAATLALLFACLTDFALRNSPVRPNPADLYPLAPLPRAPFVSPDDVPVQTLHYPAVGTVNLYGNSKDPNALVLFLSGDGGWNLGVVDMAKTLAQDGQTLVVGIDIVKYYQKLQKEAEQCLYPAGDMENLSEFVQKELQLADYHKPVLAGYSSGATLTYALLCQAPAGTFRGGIALGFCPDIELNKPLCEGSGKLTMSRVKKGRGFCFTDQAAPVAPLEVLQGEVDQDCPCRKTVDFFQGIQNVRVQQLPKVGHGFRVTKNWLPAFKQAFARILAETDRSTGFVLPNGGKKIPVAMAGAGSLAPAGLPLNFTGATRDSSMPMVLFISGDGGWTGFDQQICNQLAARHIPTVGLNSQAYFWKRKTPEQATAELEPVIRQYLQAWDKSKFILVGYSFGANVAPFIHNRLPAGLQEKEQAMVLLSPDTKGDFEIHVAGMLGRGGGPYDVVAEVRSVRNTKVLCVRGEQEEGEMETALKNCAQVRFAKIPGSHHYNNDAPRVAAAIFSTEHL